jgi:hypothetical protein
MSAFSRGCFLRPQFAMNGRNLYGVLLPKSFQQPQFFSSASILRAIKKAGPPKPLKKVLPKSKPSFTPTKAPTPATPAVYQSFASSLAQKSHPTLLYQAPSHALFMLSSYGAAVFCLSYGVIVFWSHSLHAPADLAFWVPYAYGGICFFMAAFGGWCLLGPASLVRSITALPRAAAKSGAVAQRGAFASASATATPELQLEVELRKMFPMPFFPARKLYVAPGELRINYPLAPVEKRVSAAEVSARRLQEEVERQRQLEYERSHLMTTPFRQMNRLAFEMFRAIRRTWTREGFLKIDIKGKTYKVDITGGWALDGGKALDRLVKVKLNY